MCRKKAEGDEPGYGTSRWAIQGWLKMPGTPKQRGRKPASTLTEYKYESRRLKMGNERLQGFLQSVGKK